MQINDFKSYSRMAKIVLLCLTKKKGSIPPHTLFEITWLNSVKKKIKEERCTGATARLNGFRVFCLVKLG